MPPSRTGVVEQRRPVLLYVAAPRGSSSVGPRSPGVQDQRSSKGSDPAADTGLGVALIDVEEWDPPVEMHEVLARIDRAAGARADFEAGSSESLRRSTPPP